MPWRYSSVTHSEVWVDDCVLDVCAECGDGVHSPAFDGDEAFCRPCFRDIFG